MKAEFIKTEIPPAAFYAFELPAMKARHSGAGWVPGGPCPFHDERPPGGSFRVSLDTGAFFCHACGAKGGDLITYQFRMASQKGGKDRSFCRHRFR